MGKLKRFLVFLLCMTLFLGNVLPVRAATEITAPSAILLEASTGQVIYEKNATERRSPASITKIMTLLLIFEALSEGKVSLQDEVVTSAHAKSMGGSQVFLEEGETQTLETMIKCIVIASGNDASVAVAEHIAGSEADFVEKMNAKATELGMVDTHFEDCCGLTDSDSHYTTAKDVAIMSRELTVKYPEVFTYTRIWMEDITHVTRRGSSTFTLSSTNKLLKWYQWTTGLKTGSTAKAKFCISATASKDGMDLIAVIMGAPDPKERFHDAEKLLNYGFSVSNLYVDENKEPLPQMRVEGGVEESVSLHYAEEFRYLDVTGRDLSAVEKELKLPESVKAPVTEGKTAGQAVYRIGGEEIGRVAVLYDASVEKAGFGDYFKKVLGIYFHL
ncbi:MAG: D-alanyl-D-alanine carboxypeptidase [Clostridium sp.]|jgi:D-alanyl-D-alanine carboxypeptidase (penicillin-binding protein 5/6)|nr:D-alanyl-D-alanine carboxypeptidase [Clostridium sp.]